MPLEPFRQPGAAAPLLTTIFLGANDAVLPGGRMASQHVPLAEFKSNLAQILAHARAARSTRILLLTPPPVDADARARLHTVAAVNGTAEAAAAQGGRARAGERSEEVTRQYAEACCEVRSCRCWHMAGCCARTQ